jgi:peptidyl-prolyl cis-trans isomerase C
MRSIRIASLAVIFCAAIVFAMGKKDATKEQTAQPLKTEKPATASEATLDTKPAPAAQKPAQPADKPAADKVVVTVNGRQIKNSVVEEKLDEAMRMRLGAMGGAMASTPPETLKSFRDGMRKDILENIILEQLVDEKLKADKIEVTEKDIDAKIGEITTQNGITKERIEEELAKNGITIAAFREQIKRNAGIERLIDAQIVADGESVSATDEEAKKFYDENAVRFDQPEQVRASHILIKADDNMDEAAQAEAKKKAEEILAKARAGEDFAELARTYSEDPGSKAKGGEYTFPRGRMVKPFEDTAFSLEPGQISDLVKTQFGYHIIKLSEKIPAKTQTFDDVKADIVQHLTQQKKNRYWSTLREKLKAEAKIEYSPEEKARMEAAERAIIRSQPAQPK